MNTKADIGHWTYLCIQLDICVFGGVRYTSKINFKVRNIVQPTLVLCIDEIQLPCIRLRLYLKPIRVSCKINRIVYCILINTVVFVYIS